MKNKPEAVETEAEELLFYFDKERDAALGTIGHLRIDFGRSGEEFNCTWFDHAWRYRHTVLLPDRQYRHLSRYP